MGPLRTSWTFPYTGKELVARCDELIAELADRMDESVTAEQDYERELAEYRERLRLAGIASWETARMDPTDSGGYRHSNPEAKFREKQRKIAARLTEIQEYKRQLLHDLTRDEHRTFKLTVDDIRFFGL